MKLLFDLLRWLVFLPIAMLLVSVLQTIPIFVVEWLNSTYFKGDFPSIFIVVTIVFIGGTVYSIWMTGVIASVFFSCGVVAPNKVVAAAVFGTIFTLAQGAYLLRVFSEQHWWTLAYGLFFALLVIASLFGVGYMEKEEL